MYEQQTARADRAYEAAEAARRAAWAAATAPEPEDRSERIAAWAAALDAADAAYRAAHTRYCARYMAASGDPLRDEATRSARADASWLADMCRSASLRLHQAEAEAA